MFTALTLLACAVWLAWPTLDAIASGEGVVLSSLGAPLLLVIWGIFVQDLTLDDPAARTRVGSATAIAWPILMTIGGLGKALDASLVTAGSLLVVLAGWLCRTTANQTRRGHFGVLRYSSILTGIGTASALVLTITQTDSLASVPGFSPWEFADSPLPTRSFLGRLAMIKRPTGRPFVNDLTVLNFDCLNSKPKALRSLKQPACSPRPRKKATSIPNTVCVCSMRAKKTWEHGNSMTQTMMGVMTDGS